MYLPLLNHRITGWFFCIIPSFDKYLQGSSPLIIHLYVIWQMLVELFFSLNRIFTKNTLWPYCNRGLINLILGPLALVWSISAAFLYPTTFYIMFNIWLQGAFSMMKQTQSILLFLSFPRVRSVQKHRALIKQSVKTMGFINWKLMTWKSMASM